MQLRHVVGACVLALLATSCSLGDTAESSPINVFIEVDKAVLPIGESMTITVTTRNVGFDPLTLTGPSDCLMFVDVLDTQGNVVWNSNGSCTGSTVTEAVAPGQDKAQSFSWDGTNQIGARLASGFYHIRPVARVTGAAFVGPTRSVALE